MSIVTVRDFAGSEEASGVSTRGIELFAWVRAGGRALGPCVLAMRLLLRLPSGGSSASLCARSRPWRIRATAELIGLDAVPLRYAQRHRLLSLRRAGSRKADLAHANLTPWSNG